MRPHCTVVQDHEMLQRVFEQMHNDDCSSLPVVAAGRLVGLVSLENVGEWLMIHAARSRRAPR